MPVDPLDALQPGDVPLAPRPEFVAALRARIHAAVRGEPTDGGPVTTPSWLYYFTLPTRDLALAERFYTSLFGWRTSRNADDSGFHVEDVQPPMGVSAQGDASPRLWFVVDDIAAATARVRAAGGTATAVVDYASGASVDCTDDQGTEFSLTVPTYDTAPVPSTRPGELFYFSMPVADAERARRFFGAVFGWEFDGPGEQGGQHVANVQPDGGIGGGRPGHAPDLFFRVDDLDAAMARVVELGGTAVFVGAGDEGRHAMCTDDQGIAFGLSEPAPGR
jgi:predicted enzyme related to lactoylglutathione lyase